MQVATCTVSAPFIDKYVPPARRTNRRAFIKYGRAVCDKDCMKVVWEWVRKRIREWFIVITE